jgi:hypothetical protein
LSGIEAVGGTDTEAGARLDETRRLPALRQPVHPQVCRRWPLRRAGRMVHAAADSRRRMKSTAIGDTAITQGSSIITTVPQGGRSRGKVTDATHLVVGRKARVIGHLADGVDQGEQFRPAVAAGLGHDGSTAGSPPVEVPAGITLRVRDRPKLSGIFRTTRSCPARLGGANARRSRVPTPPVPRRTLLDHR